MKTNRRELVQMTGKKIVALTMGGLLALNIAGATVPAMTSAAEAAYRHEDRYRPHEEYNHALRSEHERHERKIHEIRRKYRSHSQMGKLEREMRRERERHEKAIREIRHRFQEATRHNRPHAHYSYRR